MFSDLVAELSLHLDPLVVGMAGVTFTLDRIRTQYPASYYGTVLSRTSDAVSRLKCAIEQVERIYPEMYAMVTPLATISAQIRAACNDIAPINSLPNEILGSIFELLSISRKSHNGRDAVIVSGVCRRWRQLAVGWGALWTTIKFGSPHALDLIDLCVSRSQECQIDVIALPVSFIEPRHHLAIHRWRGLTFPPSTPTTITSFISHLLSHLEESSDRFPPLTSLNATLTTNAWTVEAMKAMKVMDNALLALTSAASLRSLSLTSFSLSSSIPLCKHITRLSLDRFYCNAISVTSQLDAILRACGQLRTVSLRKGFGVERLSASVLDTFNSLLLPELEELEMIDNDTHIEIYLLRIIRAPALRHLNFGSKSLHAGKTTPAPLLRNAISIRTFRLCEEPPRTLVLGIPALVTLTVLIIGQNARRNSQNTADTDFLKDIPPDACPNLVELHFKMKYAPIMSVVKDFITSRIDSPDVAPIRVVSFDCGRNVQLREEREADKKWFQERVQLEWKFDSYRHP